ncbi:MAG TPA: tetratricopeptide repeat protein, partial [Candidatus Eisenbacteria bacterium]
MAEDLHWADPSAIQLLHFAIRQLVGQPVRFICSSTEGLRERNAALLEFETSLTSAGLAATQDLSPLSEAGIRALVSRGFSVPEEAVRGFATQLFGWSRGNALFATEALRALVDGGQLTRRDGAWTGWEAVALEPPKGVRDLVASRLSLLSRPAQRVAEAAAVMGDRIRLRVLRQVTELSEDEMLGAIDELRTRGILREETGAGAAVSTLGFAHPLIRDCVYDRLGTARARSLHRTVAEALEGRDGDKAASDHAEELAYHYHQSGDEAPQGKALGYLLIAGRRALDRRADEEAVRHLRAALDLIERGRATEAAAHDRIAVTADLGRALNRVGRYEEAVDLYKQALRDDRGSGARLRAAALRERLGLACFFAGRYAEALDHFTAGLEAASDDPAARGKLLRMRGVCLQELARWEEANRDALEALAIAESHGDPKTRVGAHQLLTLQHTWTGSPALAREHGWQAIREAEAAGDLSGAFEAHISLAMTEGLTGNLPEMRRRIDEARSLAEKLRSPILHLRVDEISLQEAHATGAWNAAVALGEDAVARARSLGQRALLPRLLVWTALPLLGRGQIEKASAMVTEAWALAGLGPAGEAGANLDLHAAIPAFIGRAALDLTEGNLAAAKAIAERGVEIADRSGAAIWSLHHLMPLLGQAYLLARDLEGAERLGRRLRREAIRMDHVLGLAWADACDALVTWLGGDVEGGCTRLRAAADRLDGIPMVFEAARVRRQFAGRLADLGRVEEALVELRRAHTVFSDLG